MARLKKSIRLQKVARKLNFLDRPRKNIFFHCNFCKFKTVCKQFFCSINILLVQKSFFNLTIYIVYNIFVIIYKSVLNHPFIAIATVQLGEVSYICHIYLNKNNTTVLLYLFQGDINFTKSLSLKRLTILCHIDYHNLRFIVGFL